MKTIKLLALLAALGMGLGCSTVLGVVEDVCDTALGGSKVGDSACGQLDKLRSDPEAEQ